MCVSLLNHLISRCFAAVSNCKVKQLWYRHQHYNWKCHFNCHKIIVFEIFSIYSCPLILWLEKCLKVSKMGQIQNRLFMSMMPIKNVYRMLVPPILDTNINLYSDDSMLLISNNRSHQLHTVRSQVSHRLKWTGLFSGSEWKWGIKTIHGRHWR